MIFNLFKSKPTLKELIPKGFIDIHSHILPGIDDGSKNIKESIAIINKMKEYGFSKVIGTPHTYPGLHNNTNETIKKSYKLIEDEIHNIIETSYASEYMLCAEFIEKILDKSVLCLKDKYVLIEMSFISQPVNLYEYIFEIKVNDFIPVLAHPERYLFLNNDLKNYKKLKKYGCKFQLNLLSAVGHYGYDVLKATDKLLSNGMIDFVGTDAHRIEHLEKLNNKAKINYNNIKKLEKAMIANKIFR